MNYIFDVDGTLTPSRSKIDGTFANWFEHFAAHHAVYFVTGSDRPKTLEQLGEQVYNSAVTVYQCNGNDVWQQSRRIRSSNVDWHGHTIGFFSNELARSDCKYKTGKHVEYRPGCINFSTLGRAATEEQRRWYVQYDLAVGERQLIADRFNERFPQYKASVAGETGIDITVKGCDKSQILADMSVDEDIFFFGDKCRRGGNDYEIAQAVSARAGGRVAEVDGWEDTWKTLKQLLG